MSTVERSDLMNFRNISTRYGLAAGLLMAAFLIVMQVTNNDYSPFVKLSKYFLLAIPIILALKLYKEKYSGDIFIKGVSLSAKLSLIAGCTLVLINLLLYMVSPDLAFSKYSLEPTSIIQMIVISAIIFFETFVFGNLISFICLQYLKDRYKN